MIRPIAPTVVGLEERHRQRDQGAEDAGRGGEGRDDRADEADQQRRQGRRADGRDLLPRNSIVPMFSIRQT